MRKKSLTFLLLAIACSAFSQTKEIYVNPKFNQLAKDHQKVAILPFRASVQLRPKQMQSMTPERFERMQKDEGLAVQSALQTYFLKRKEQHAFAITFQDINTTNALLQRTDITEENINKYSPGELAEILGVDAIITGMLATQKPMSEGASLALGLLVGYYGATNSGKCTININDAATGELLWKYEKTLSRSLGSDTSTIINTMMRKASRRLPYIN